MHSKESRNGHWFYKPDETSDSKEEWLRWRARGIGATDAVVLAGVSPWKTIQELWKEKVTGKSEVVENWAMKRGKELEPLARDIYEYQNKVLVPPKNVVHKKFDFIKASLDGYNEKLSLIVEIKTPGKSDLEIAKKNMIPAKYYPQVQWQLMITEFSACDYVTYDGKETIYVKRVFPDLKYQRNLLRVGRWFWKQVQEKKEITEYDLVLKTKLAPGDLA